MKYLKIRGQMISVSEEVYYAYKRPVWIEQKNSQVRDKNEVSLEMHTDIKGFELPSEEIPIEEIIEDRLMLEMLHNALDKLSEDERFLINELFYKNKSEREISLETGVSKTGIHKQKENILLRMRKLLKKW